VGVVVVVTELVVTVVALTLEVVLVTLDVVLVPVVLVAEVVPGVVVVAGIGWQHARFVHVPSARAVQ
jgi:hypothetical protein